LKRHQGKREFPKRTISSILVLPCNSIRVKPFRVSILSW
jgi:hypothetical protein